MLLAVGCEGVATPETPRERLVAAEVSFGLVLDQVKLLTINGQIIPGSETANRVAFLLVEARGTLDAWQVDPDNINFATTTSGLLIQLRALLAASLQETSYIPIFTVAMAGYNKGGKIV